MRCELETANRTWRNFRGGWEGLTEHGEPWRRGFLAGWKKVPQQRFVSMMAGLPESSVRTLRMIVGDGSLDAVMGRAGFG